MSAGPVGVGSEELYTDPFLVLEPGRHTAPIRRLDADREGRFLVTASDDKTVRVWAAEDGRLLRTLRLPAGSGHVGKAFAIAVSPDASLIAVGGYSLSCDHDVYLYHRANGRLSKRVGPLPNSVNHLAFSTNGKQLAIALNGSAGIGIYDLEKESIIAVDSDYNSPVYGAAFDARGRLATTCLDGRIRLYNSNLECLALAVSSEARPYDVAFSSDGGLLTVSHSYGSTIEIFHGRTLRPHFIVSIDEPYCNLHSVAWSLDGSVLYAAGWRDSNHDANLRIWPDSGRGAPFDVPVSRDLVTDLRPLPSGRLAFISGEPQVGLLDRNGEKLWHIERVTADFRAQDQAFAISADGTIVRFSYEPWGRSPVTFNLLGRRLTPDEGTRCLTTARRTATGFEVENWHDSFEPTLNGQKLDLQDQERSCSFAVLPNEQGFLTLQLRLPEPSG